MNIGHGNPGGYGQYDHPMLTSGSSFYANFNSNNNAPVYYNRGSDSGDQGRFQQHSLQFKSRVGKKKRKSQVTRVAFYL